MNRQKGRGRGEIYRSRDILEADGKRQRRTDKGEHIERKRTEKREKRQWGRDRGETQRGET